MGSRGKGNVMDRSGSVGLDDRGMSTTNYLNKMGFFNAKVATTSRVKGR